jgi:ribosome-associated translation inhibitor RaiA
MNSDITERLRAAAGYALAARGTALEAADEIERLRAALDAAMQTLQSSIREHARTRMEQASKEHRQ